MTIKYLKRQGLVPSKSVGDLPGLDILEEDQNEQQQILNKSFSARAALVMPVVKIPSQIIIPAVQMKPKNVLAYSNGLVV